MNHDQLVMLHAELEAVRKQVSALIVLVSEAIIEEDLAAPISKESQETRIKQHLRDLLSGSVSRPKKECVSLIWERDLGLRNEKLETYDTEKEAKQGISDQISNLVSKRKGEEDPRWPALRQTFVEGERFLSYIKELDK